MSNVIFLIRPRPMDNECLSSYIQRIANANHINSNDIWGMLNIGESKYPQSPSSYLLDIMPELIFDIRESENMLLLDSYYLDRLTFKNVIKKLYSKTETKSELISLNKMFSRYRKYCPMCINEMLYYKLIWQVDEIKTCNIHHTKLISQCENCKRIISVLPSNTKLGVCPHCYSSISQNGSLKNEELSQESIYEQWLFLIEDNFNRSLSYNGLSKQQELALKMLYVLGNSLIIPHRRMLFNIARGNRILSSYLFLSLILDILRKTNISIKTVFESVPTQDFINHIVEKKISQIDDTSIRSCIHLII